MLFMEVKRNGIHHWFEHCNQAADDDIACQYIRYRKRDGKVYCCKT